MEPLTWRDLQIGIGLSPFRWRCEIQREGGWVSVQFGPFLACLDY